MLTTLELPQFPFTPVTVGEANQTSQSASLSQTQIKSWTHIIISYYSNIPILLYAK